MKKGLFSSDGMCHTQKNEKPYSPDTFQYPTVSQEELECCLNCKKPKCTGSCKKIREISKIKD